MGRGFKLATWPQRRLDPPAAARGPKHERWRRVAKLARLSREASLRLEWIIFYYQVAGENATATCRHFGIPRKSFYKWLKRFQRSQENVKVLEDRSRAPHNKRQWEVTLEEETRIKQLRREHMHYGKQKLKVLYEKLYGETISTWKIERVIRKHQLYPDKRKAEKVARKIARAKQRPKNRITALKKQEELWFLLQLDTIIIYSENLKRYILTSVDHASKLGYARMYRTSSSASATDFLYRLQYLVSHPIMNLQTDNGSEFACHFEAASRKLGIQRYFSRLKTPKDNPEVERFNGTLKHEWLYDSNLTTDCDEFNHDVTEWLVEYNFHRPHQSLDYLTPMEYIQKRRGRKPKLLPMSPARTRS